MSQTTTPPDVVAAAQQHGLGSVVAVRVGTHPLLKALYSIVTAAALFGVIMLLYVIGQHVSFRAGEKVVGFLGLGACVFMVAFVIYAVVALIRGRRSYFLWSGGLVYRHNSKVRAHRWDEVTELRARRVETGEHAGRIFEYEVVTQAGKPIRVSVESSGNDPFVDAVVAAAHANGRPVT